MLLVYVCLIDTSVYNCTQCKANSNIANFTLRVIIKWQVLHFYTSKAKLLFGTVFSCQNIYIIIAFYDFILYRYSSSTKDILHITPLSQRRVLLKRSTRILHFTSCKNELWKLQWREFHSLCSVQQNPISRKFKPLQFIFEGN